MKKSIIIAAMAVAVITLGIITACSKETPTTNERNAPAVKSSHDHALQSLLRTIWYLTDSVYRAKPALLLDIASEDNLDAFCDLTGIRTEQLSEYVNLASIRIGNNEGNAPEAPGCNDCDKFALSNYIDKCATLRALLNEIHEYEPNFVDSTIIRIPDRITPCEYECLWRYSYIHHDSQKYIECLIDCHMRHSLDEAVKHLEVLNPKPRTDILY